MRHLLVLLWLLCSAAGLEAQNAGMKATMFNLSYAGQLPGGDLRQDYNRNFNVGFGVQYLTSQRWLMGATTGFLFGADPETDVLGHMRTAEGEIISEERSFAVVLEEGRGFTMGLMVGKIFPFKKGQTSGLRVTLSPGILQHRIRIEDRSGGLPQLAGDYAKGYDRLTNGFALTEFIGYQHFGEDGLINFFAGLEFTQGWTRNRRSWDFYTNTALDAPRLDLLTGIRVGWSLLLVHDSYDTDQIFY